MYIEHNQVDTINILFNNIMTLKSNLAEHNI